MARLERRRLASRTNLFAIPATFDALAGVDVLATGQLLWLRSPTISLPIGLPSPVHASHPGDA
jgi:hypothetical protein